MKKEELKGLSVEQLTERLAAERSTARNLRFAHAISPLENPMRIRHSRRTVAQLMTELRNREVSKNS
jgi:large subunit ribosomal protein L29